MQDDFKELPELIEPANKRLVNLQLDQELPPSELRAPKEPELVLELRYKRLVLKFSVLKK